MNFTTFTGISTGDMLADWGFSDGIYVHSHPHSRMGARKSPVSLAEAVGGMTKIIEIECCKDCEFYEDQAEWFDTWYAPYCTCDPVENTLINDPDIVQNWCPLKDRE